MNLFAIISMFGGLALFLFGMHEMSSGLEKLSGGTLEKTLKKFTSNIFKAILLGIIVTAIIQSSSATTVIVVGLVNSGLLSLRQSIGVMMGANIGTTITGQITRLIDLDTSSASSVLKFFSPSTLAPFFAIIGIILIMGFKGNKQNIIGQIVIGFSILFTGLLSMSSSVAPLAESPAFLNVLSYFSEIPILGLIAGAIVTAIIQSSSASVGMLQALSSTGALTFSSIYPIILGQNIGTCATSVISSIGTSRNAKRATSVHVYFNVIGSLLFLILLTTLQSCGVFSALWGSTVDSGMIANFHTVFNIVTTLLLLPLASVLEKLAVLTIRNKKNADDEDDVDVETGVLDDRFLATPSLAITQCFSTLNAMGTLATKNVRFSLKLFKSFSDKKLKKINNREEKIDQFEDALAGYIVKLNDYKMTGNNSREITYILRVMPEIERIGDHAQNISQLAQNLHNLKNIKFSEQALKELNTICSAVDEAIDLASSCIKDHSLDAALSIEPLVEIIDIMQNILKQNHVERIRNSNCNIEAGIIFIDLMINLKQISDHCSNISLATIALRSNLNNLSHHEYLKKLYSKDSPELGSSYTASFESYKDKYLSAVNL